MGFVMGRSGPTGIMVVAHCDECLRRITGGTAYVLGNALGEAVLACSARCVDALRTSVEGVPEDWRDAEDPPPLVVELDWYLTAVLHSIGSSSAAVAERELGAMAEELERRAGGTVERPPVDKPLGKWAKL